MAYSESVVFLHTLYIDIPCQCVLPLMNTHQSVNFRFIYQHDGCGPHRAKRVVEFLHSNRVNVLPWSAQIPDLNPTENVWRIMKRRLRIQPTHPNTADELYEQLCTIWKGLPHDHFTKLSHSMVQRCRIKKSVSGCLFKY